MANDLSFGIPDQFSDGGPAKSLESYPNPWLDYASTVIPNSLTQVLRWAEFIWLSNGIYRSALQRTARYFLTKLIIKDVDDEESERIRADLEDELRIVEQATEAGDSFLAYGNVIATLNVPFTRYLVCDCGASFPIKQAHAGNPKKFYEWQGGKFMKPNKGGKCNNPKCTSCNPEYVVADKESKDIGDLNIKIHNPHEIEIGHNPYSNRKVFYWNINSELKRLVKEGAPIALEDTPMSIVDCIIGGDSRFRFNDDLVFHSADPGPAGLITGGWGLPRVLSNFRQAFHWQVLNRFDQAIAMDYINGMRTISPATSGSGSHGGDPLLGSGGGSAFRSNVMRMVAEHKRDPNTWHTSPYPLQYQLFGGEGRELAPVDMKNQVMDDWLNATNIPAELYRGTLTIQSAPTALRIFENSWPELTNMYNNMLRWLCGYLTKVMDYPEFQASWLKVRMADDIERRQVMLQLMAGNQISPQTALEVFGIDDPREEIRRTFGWHRAQAEEEKNFQEEMKQDAEADIISEHWKQKSQMQSTPPGMVPGPDGVPMPDPAAAADPMGGGMGPMDPSAVGPAAAAPNQDMMQSPDGVMAEADRLAQEIYAMESSQRKSALINLKKTNPELHAMTKQRLEELDQQAAQQGVQQGRQQAAAGGM